MQTCINKLTNQYIFPYWRLSIPRGGTLQGQKPSLVCCLPINYLYEEYTELDGECQVSVPMGYAKIFVQGKHMLLFSMQGRGQVIPF